MRLLTLVVLAQMTEIWTKIFAQHCSRLGTNKNLGRDQVDLLRNDDITDKARYVSGPSSIYSWSISHILEQEFFCLGRLGSSGSSNF